ncbi:MAG: glycosyl hydrolase family 28-related protein [Bacteroidota bacterium]
MAIIQKTIQDLRTFSGTPTLGDNYYVTDPGMEGMWYYDGTSSLNDNTGTILTSGWNYATIPPTPPITAKPQFRRIYDGYVNVKWFGAVGDGVTNDGAVILAAKKAAIDYANDTNAGADKPDAGIYFPTGIYKIEADVSFVGPVPTLTVNSVVFERNLVVSFEPGARILIGKVVNTNDDLTLNPTVIWNSKIDATNDQWIFDYEIDGEDERNENNPNGTLATNYSNKISTPVVKTARPLSFFSDTLSPQNLNNYLTSKVSIKWFGATGGGYTGEAINDYFYENYVPEGTGGSRLYYDDTKAIRFGLTAISSALAFPQPVFSSSCGGPCTLYMPKGCYVFTDTLYVSAGTFLEGDGAIPLGGSQLFMIWPGSFNSEEENTTDGRNGIVLQSSEAGGTGKGASAHILRNLVISCRPTGGDPVNNVNSNIIKFEDNAFNYDTRFYNLRFSNAPINGSVIYVNEKNYRDDDTTAPNLDISLHIYDSMIDVCLGDFIRLGEKGSGRFRIYNTQFFDIWRNLVYNPVKPDYTYNSTLIKIPQSLFEFRNCNFEGCGRTSVIDLSDDKSPCVQGDIYKAEEYNPFLNSADEKAEYIFSDCSFISQAIDYRKFVCEPEITIPTRVGGGRFKISAAKTLSIIDSSFEYRSHNFSLNGIDYVMNSQYAYLLELLGHIDTLEICGNRLENNNDTTDFTIRLGYATNYSCDYLNISNNIFVRNKRSHISSIPFTPPHVTIKSGKIEDNQFSAVNDFYDNYTSAIFGEFQKGVILQGNVFSSLQDVIGMPLYNYGMKGGANYGEVYVDPDLGDDTNFGLSLNWPVQTFDGALNIVNQRIKANNPVQKIYLKEGATPISKSASPIEIENADILICSYGSGNAILLFDVDVTTYSTGYLLLGSNVKLTFKGVDIDVSHTSTSLAPTSSVLSDVSFFCLKDNFSQIHFESSTINLQAYYALVSSYVSSFGVFETKMVNVSVLDVTPLTGAGAWLCNAGNFMAIDCVAYNSTITGNMAAKVNRGWDVGLLVRNSFL